MSNGQLSDELKGDVSAESDDLVYSGLWIPFILVVVCFPLWGAANNMTDLLVPAFQKVLSMSQLQSSFIQSAFYGAYFCMALPAALLIQKYSYKSGVLIGLCTFAVGAALCYPASLSMSFNVFLMAFYVFAAGCAILETVAAPYIMSMGPANTATQRINLAQAFNPLGVLMGVFLGKEVILKGLNSANATERSQMSVAELNAIQSAELGNVVTAYVIVGFVALVLALVIKLSRFPAGQDTVNQSTLREAYGRLKKNRKFKFAVITQFFYVGCQIGLFTYSIKYLMDNHPAVATEAEASTYVLYALACYALCRFLFTFMMSYVSPAKVLSFVAGMASILMLVTVFVGGTIGSYAMLACFCCLAPMFPTIYGLGLEGVGDDRKLGGSIIIMAIIGGATLVPFQGWLIDMAGSSNTSYLMSFCCFIVVLVFSLSPYKRSYSM